MPCSYPLIRVIPPLTLWLCPRRSLGAFEQCMCYCRSSIKATMISTPRGAILASLRTLLEKPPPGFSLAATTGWDEGDLLIGSVEDFESITVELLQGGGVALPPTGLAEAFTGPMGFEQFYEAYSGYFTHNATLQFTTLLNDFLAFLTVFCDQNAENQALVYAEHALFEEFLQFPLLQEIP